MLGKKKQPSADAVASIARQVRLRRSQPGDFAHFTSRAAGGYCMLVLRAEYRRKSSPAGFCRISKPVAIALAVVAFTILANAQTNPKHFFWAPNQPNTPNPSAIANDLIYHGGNAGQGAIGVENKPAAYLIFWGPDWANGFTTSDASGQSFTSAQLQSYVTSFLTNLGGTSWAAIPTEYCNNIPAGNTTCANITGANYVTNPRKQLKGVWTDSTAVPSDIIALGLAENLADDPLAQEAIRASAHFN
jgi:hypothetical protein